VSIFFSRLRRGPCAVSSPDPAMAYPPGRAPKKPPMLKPIAQEDAVAKLGVKISDRGTLQIDLANGQHVAVRPDGVTSARDADSLPEGADTPLELLGKIRWADLRMGRIIGEGSQAKVRKVKHRTTGQVYALKVITLNKQVTKRTLQQELAHVLAATNHPNVVASADAFYIDGALKVLMEYMDLGTLANVIKLVNFIPEDALSCITKQILEGLKSLHANDLLHRDIKPSNLLVDSSGVVKISDFGVSTFLNSVNPFAMTLIGSTAYMSPERVRADKYDSKSDIWSIGLTVAQCALGVFPFITDDGKGDPEDNPFEKKINMFDLAAMLAEANAKVDFDRLLPKIKRFYPEWSTPLISDRLKDFVWQCTRQDPHQRPSCAELLDHEFITTYLGKVNLRRWFREHGVVPHRDREGSTGGPGQSPMTASTSSSLRPSDSGFEGSQASSLAPSPRDDNPTVSPPAPPPPLAL